MPRGTYAPEEFFDYGERFAAAAVAAKARPVLYQTYEAKSPSDDLLYLDYAYMTLGRKTGSLVAPVGRVWHRVREAKGFDLYHEDGMHPSVYLFTAGLVLEAGVPAVRRHA